MNTYILRSLCQSKPKIILLTNRRQRTPLYVYIYVKNSVPKRWRLNQKRDKQNKNIEQEWVWWTRWKMVNNCAIPQMYHCQGAVYAVMSLFSNAILSTAIIVMIRVVICSVNLKIETIIEIHQQDCNHLISIKQLLHLYGTQ